MRKYLLRVLPALLLLVALTACRRDMMAPTVTPTETAVTEPDRAAHGGTDGGPCGVFYRAPYGGPDGAGMGAGV